jgi:hypothetical protein
MHKEALKDSGMPSVTAVCPTSRAACCPLARSCHGALPQGGGSSAPTKFQSLKANALASIKASGAATSAPRSVYSARRPQRYYNNNFVDQEKQNCINVFLGNFIPRPADPDVWCATQRGGARGGH